MSSKQHVAVDNKLERVLSSAADRAVQSSFARLIPTCMLLYVLSYIDRINIGFAALSMNAGLGLSATTFGVVNAAFYVMYGVCEVPSNMFLARFGARRWISRIMISWGVASMATALVVGPKSLFLLRALLGAAEAGLLPGILFYLGFWFPKQYRARASSGFLASLPLALIVGGPLSGLVMKLDGSLGIEGWRWLFLVEGIPPIIVGICVWRFLPNDPNSASWLSSEEKESLINCLRDEVSNSSVKDELKANHEGSHEKRLIVLLSLSYLCLLVTINTLGVWTPQIIKEFVGRAEISTVGLLSAIPPLFAIVAMQCASWWADKKGKSNALIIGSILFAIAGWILVASPSRLPASKLIGLAICFSAVYSAVALFWASVTQSISRGRQAVGIAFISTTGTIATITTPIVIGVLRDRTGSFAAGAWYAVVSLVLAVIAFRFAGHVRRHEVYA